MPPFLKPIRVITPITPHVLQYSLLRVQASPLSWYRCRSRWGRAIGVAMGFSIVGSALPAMADGTTYCESPYGEVYSTVTPNKLYAIHGPTGAAVALTTSTYSVTAINGMATDHVNKLVYYGDGNNLYAWDAIANKHILITNNFSSFLPASYTSKYQFTTLSSGGAAFYNGSLYFGVDGNAPAGLNPDFEIFKIDFVVGSDGTQIQQVTPLDISGNSQGGLLRNDEDWGDFVISNTGVILGLSNRNVSGTGAHIWNYDLNTKAYTNIGAPTGGNHQLAKSGDGKLWALFSSGNVQEILPNGTYTGPIKSTVSVSDAGECVVGNAIVGDRVWSDLNGNGAQDTGEPGIAGVQVAIYRDINKNGAIDTNEPLLATQTTDANGNYNFSELLPHDVLSGAGHNDFMVKVVGGVPSGGTATTPTTKPADLSSATQVLNTVDFGYRLPVQPTNQPPTTDDKTAIAQPNPNGTNTVVVPALSGSDPEDGALGTGKSFKITTLPTNATLYYDGTPITTPGFVIANYDPTKLTIDPNDGAITVSFQYAAIDSNNQEDTTPATVTMLFTSVVTVSVSGTVWNDADNSAQNTLTNIQTGSETGANVASLNAILVNSSGTVVATTPINPDGTYEFTNLQPNQPQLMIRVSPNPGVINQSAPTAALPIGWINTSPLEYTAFDLGTTDLTDKDFGVLKANPNLLLVKRITRINGETQTRDGDDLSLYKDEATNPYDDNLDEAIPFAGQPRPNQDDTMLWPNLTTFLLGGTNGGITRPGDEVEYTIYFLSAGNSPAKSVLLCDLVPQNTTFIPTAFNTGLPPNPSGLEKADRGIAWMYNGTQVSLTNINDGDAAYYFPPSVDPSSLFPSVQCGGANTNGAVVVDLGNLPNATAPGSPMTSYGFIRFRGRVK